MDDTNSDNVVTLQSICQDITSERAQELLEAASGNLERAIDIFFFQQQQQQQQQHEQQQHDPTASNNTIDQKKELEQPVTPLIVKTPTTTVKRAVKSPGTPRGGGTTKGGSAKKKPRQSQLDFGRSKQPRLDTHFGFQSSPQQQQQQQQQRQGREKAAATDDPFEGNPSIDEEAAVSQTTTTTSITEPLYPAATEIISIDEDDDNDNDDNDQPPSQLPQEGEEDEVLPTPECHEVAMKQTSGRHSEISESTEITFQRLAETLQQLTDTTKRLVKLDVLKEFILHIRQQQQPQQPNEDLIRSRAKTLTCGLYLILGFRGEKPLDVGGSAMTKALQTILGASRMQLSKAYRHYGDLGDAAASLFQKKSFFVSASNPTKSLTVLQVYETFQKIIATDGRDAKQSILLQLLRACNTKTEIRFLVRLLIGNMRVGANLKTVLAALAMAFVPESNHKPAIELIQKTHDICPNLESIITALLEGGLDQVQKDCQIQLLTPIAPMLAHPIHSLEQVAKIMTTDVGQSQPMTMEWKYDGVRCQAHYDGTTMKLFSRHMLETTSQYPDAAKAILDARRSHSQAVNSFIIDAEIVGVEEREGQDYRLLPFQDLSRRKKKNDNGQGVRVKVFCFDLMYLDGISCIHESLHIRQAKMRECFGETVDFAYVSSQLLPTYDESRICSFLEQAVEKGAEGLMLKLLGSSWNMQEALLDNGGQEATSITTTTAITSNSPYEAGTRSHSWLKVKKDYVAGYADTIDVVPIGAWYGHGRKAQKSFLSPVLLAVYDDEEEVYRSICRCMSFTDAMYEAMREFYFRGTPYPEQVGMEKVAPTAPPDSNSDTVTITSNPVLTVIPEMMDNDGNDVDEENDGDQDNSDDDRSSENDNDMEEDERSTSRIMNDDGMDDAASVSMVHCFPSRPSSAYIVTNESPPIWFRPMEVFEVSFADLSLSKQHTAAAGLLLDEEPDRGVALRFPRFKRRRPDKTPEQATTSRQIAQLFLQQSKQASSSTSKRKQQPL